MVLKESEAYRSFELQEHEAVQLYMQQNSHDPKAELCK